MAFMIAATILIKQIFLISFMIFENYHFDLKKSQVVCFIAILVENLELVNYLSFLLVVQVINQPLPTPTPVFNLLLLAVSVPLQFS